MEEIIKKAIEGGYKNNVILNFDMYKPDVQMIRFKNFTLDPLFWQALGKARGWDIEHRTGYDLPTVGNRNHKGSGCTKFCISKWRLIALRFHEINLTEDGDKAVEWLKELIKNTK